MITYQKYYEAFSLNPKDWFSGWKNNLTNDIAYRQQVAKEKMDAYAAYQKGMADLEKWIKDNDHKLVAAPKGQVSYYSPDEKEIGVGFDEIKNSKQFENEKVLNMREIRELFEIAHEVGHGHQFDKKGNERKLEDYLRVLADANQRSSLEGKYAADAYRMWKELDAWINGMQFIPDEYKGYYKKYAYHNLKTYMSLMPANYKLDPVLNHMWKQLGLAEHEHDRPDFGPQNKPLSLRDKIADKIAKVIYRGKIT